MMARVQQFYDRLSPRDQRVLLLGATAALVLVVIALIMPLQTGVSAAASRVTQKRNDLSWLQSLGPRLSSLRTPAPAPLHESLVVLVDRTARDAGLGKSLVGSEPSGNGGLNVRLEQAPFDELVGWLTQIGERYGVRAESASFQADKAPGTVDVTLVLRTR